jgi:tetratricopeptide (TPR) repeat protein
VSGKGPGAGFDYQARLNAYVLVHVLAERPLRWTKASAGDVPVAVIAESGGSGDDVRVELRDVDVIYECQAKRGLCADKRLNEATDGFAAGLPQHPEERGILLVDPHAARTVASELRDALEARRQGTTPKESGAYKKVLERLRSAGAEKVVDRIYVIELDVENDASNQARTAIDLLAVVLDDPDQSGAAWGVLVADGLRMCREGGRRDRQAVIRTLGQDNVAINGEPRGTQAQLRVVSEQQLIAVGGVQEAVSILKGMTDAATHRQDVFTVKLDSAQDMLQRGNPDAALALLRSFDTDTASVDAVTRVRHRNLSGLTLIHLGKTADARLELQAALRIDSINTAAISNLAQLAMTEGRPEEAATFADRARAIEPLAMIAWLVIAQCRPEVVIPTEIASEPPFLAVQANRLLQENQLPEAIRLLREAMNVGGFDAERAFMLARALAWGPMTGVSADDDAACLDEATDLLKAALAADPDRHYPARAVRALIMRGQIELFRGRVEGVEAYEEAARLDPMSDAVIPLAQVWLNRQEPGKALRAIESVPQGAREAPVQAMLARVFLALSRPDDARLAFDEAVRLNEVVDRGLSIVLIELAVEAEWLDAAEQLLDVTFSTPDWIERLFRARVAWRRGQTDVANSFFREAIDARKDVPADVSKLRGEFSEFLRKRGLAGHSVEQLELAGAPALKELRQSYGRALYDAREFAKAAELVELVKSEGSPLPRWVLGLGAHIASCADDVLGMVEFLSQELEREPDNVEVALRLAHAYLRLNESPKTLVLLDQVREGGGAAPQQMLYLAELYIRAEAPEHALPLAYAAWRAEPLSENVQLAFIGLCTQLEHRAEPDPVSVAPDTRIRLKSDDSSTQSYFIVGEGIPSAIVGEIAIGSSLAVALLGKRVGDRVTLRPGELSQSDMTLVEIRSRYVYAFQDIMTNFPQRHPDSAALQMFRVPDDPKIEDLKFMTEAARLGAESYEKVHAMYAQHQLPIGFVAKLLGRSVADAYDFAAWNRSSPFWVEFGDAFERAHDAAASTRPAVITRTALMTLVYLDILDIVPQTHPNLVVPRSLLDELSEERVHLARAAREGFLGADYQDGRLQLESAPADHFKRRLAGLDATIAWVQQNCTCHSRPLATIGQKAAEEERERYGASSYDSIILAEALSGELFADDFGLRRTFLAKTGRVGFSTFTLLAAAHRSEKVSAVQYDRHVGALIRLNHCPIPMSASALRTAFEDDAFQFSDKVNILVNVLRDSEETLATLVVYASDVLRGLAVSVPGRSHLANVTRILAEAISERRDALTVVKTMKFAVSSRMRLLPAEHDTIHAALGRYGEFVRSGRSVLL